MKLLSVQSRGAFEAWVWASTPLHYQVEFKSLGKKIIGSVKAPANNQTLTNPWAYLGKAASTQ